MGVVACHQAVRARDNVALELGLLFVRCVGEIDGDFFAEVLGDLLQREAGGFGEEEINY